jgi:ankyrin repeat/BTB/POZ domain-containing protein 2
MYACAGSADDLRVEAGDILELMAAANFFQLDGLLHYCEYRCADLIDLDTIVSYYIHAKVGHTLGQRESSPPYGR